MGLYIGSPSLHFSFNAELEVSRFPYIWEIDFSNPTASHLAVGFLRKLTFPDKYLSGLVDRGISQVGLLQQWANSDSIALDLTGTDLQL